MGLEVFAHQAEVLHTRAIKAKNKTAEGKNEYADCRLILSISALYIRFKSNVTLFPLDYQPYQVFIFACVVLITLIASF